MGTGMLLVPPLTQVLLDANGWRAAHQIVGLATLCAIPLILCLPLSRIGAGSSEWQAARGTQSAGNEEGWTVADALRTSAFWGLFSAYFWTSVAAYSVLPQSVAYLTEQGFKPLVAASAFGMTGMLSAFGIVAIGWLSDRVGRIPTALISYMITLSGIIALILVASWPSLVLVYAFVIPFGLMQGARGPIIVSMISHLYRGGRVGSIFGMLSIAMGSGQATGSLASGLLQQWTGAYTASFSLGVFGCLCGMASFWFVPSLRHERIDTSATA
jgi:predicted MFS family arabinose efflux permease